MSTPTFWLEATDLAAVGLRRYSMGEGGYDCEHGHHQALVYTGLESAAYTEREHGGRHLAVRTPVSHDDPDWPTTCTSCSYAFVEDDHWQEWQEQVYERIDTGERLLLHPNAPAPELGIPSAGPGASWSAWWMPSSMRQVDGIYLMVRLPNGHDWAVDSRASNCGSPDDNEHRCWVRHGKPQLANITVDKNGLTCNAGAGSIQGGDWHGFLTGGQLIGC